MNRARYPNKVPGTTMEHGLAQSHGTSWLKPEGWGSPGFNISRTVDVKPPAGTENYTGSGGEPLATCIRSVNELVVRDRVNASSLTSFSSCGKTSSPTASVAGPVPDTHQPVAS